MPNILTNPDYEVNSNLTNQDFNYQYPYDLDLRPGSVVHERIKTEVLQRARASSKAMSTRFDSWNKIDKKMTGYITTDAEEDDVKTEDDRKPVSIVFPYSYAIAETLLSYLVAAFFQDPIFMYEGFSPEDILGAILMEKVIELQCHRNKVALALHTKFRDEIVYGLGAVAPQWTKVVGQKMVKRQLSKSLINMISGKKEYKKEIQEDVTLFEGNTLRNIDPYKYLPDPNVPVHEVQKGEFVGWLDDTRYINLLDQEVHSDDMFNVKYLNVLTNRFSSIYSSDQSARNEKTGRVRVNDAVLKPVDVLYMYVNFVPEEWGLPGDKPAKWLFTLGSDEVVIQAKPLGLTHNMFPVAVGAPDYDGYTCTPLSRIELMFGMQETLDWLFNSHIANVRKVVNDTLIVDPYMLNMNDLRKGKAGGIIRLRRPAWGRGVAGSYEQLKVSDITRTNITDSQFIMQWMNKASAADESVMGSLRQGGPDRLTGQEFEGTRMGAISRLERMARIIGIQSMRDIGYMFASHCQQLMSEEVYVNTIGRWRDTLAKSYGDKVSGPRMKVDPMDLLIDYDLVVRDGSIPGGNFSKVWIQLFQAVTKDPELRQTFDVIRIFKHIARNMGAKDVEQFVKKQPIQAKTMPDENVDESVRKGDLVPLPGRGPSAMMGGMM